MEKEIRVNATEPVFGGQLGEVSLRVHDRSQCEGRGIPCCVHSPSAHHMVSWPMNWRADTGVMERTCVHGIGHPDIDHLRYVMSVDPETAKWQSVHGCDGCCFPPGEERDDDLG